MRSAVASHREFWESVAACELLGACLPDDTGETLVSVAFRSRRSLAAYGELCRRYRARNGSFSVASDAFDSVLLGCESFRYWIFTGCRKFNDDVRCAHLFGWLYLAAILSGADIKGKEASAAARRPKTFMDLALEPDPSARCTDSTRHEREEQKTAEGLSSVLGVKTRH